MCNLIMRDLVSLSKYKELIHICYYFVKVKIVSVYTPVNLKKYLGRILNLYSSSKPHFTLKWQLSCPQITPKCYFIFLYFKYISNTWIILSTCRIDINLHKNVDRALKLPLDSRFFVIDHSIILSLK